MGPAQPPPPTLFEQSAVAFGMGNDFAGLSLLQMYYLNADESHLERQVKWVPALKRPTAITRWGVGVVYTAPRGYTGHPRPIGFNNPNANAGAPAGGNQGKSLAELRKERAQRPQSTSAPPQNVPVPTDPEGILDFYAGDFADAFLAELELRMSAGEMGAVLAATGAKRKPAGPPGSSPAPQPAGGVNPNIPWLPGVMTPEMQEKVKAAQKDGKFDTSNLPAELKNLDPKMLGNLMQKAQGALGDLKPIIPGVSFLGVGNAIDLEKKAKAAQLDLLMVFTVDVRPATAADIVNNNTRVKVTTVAKGEELYESPLLNNLKVEEAREARTAKDKDPVDAERAKFAAVLEAKLKPAELPAGLTAEVAAKRVDALAAEGLKKLMTNVVEMKLYQSKGLVTEDQFLAAMGQALGPNLMSSLAQAMAGAEAGEGDEKKKVGLGDVLDQVMKKLGDEPEEP
jgi:hypothetical protein